MTVAISQLSSSIGLHPPTRAPQAPRLSALGLKKYMEVTVEEDGHLDLSEFDVSAHAGVLLDGVGDAITLHYNREALQGRLKEGRGLSVCQARF